MDDARATAIVEVQPQARRLISGGDVSGIGAAGYGWFAEEKYHNTQIEIIRSRDVSQRVVRTLGLESHPMFAEHPSPADAFRKMIMVTPRRDTGHRDGWSTRRLARFFRATASARLREKKRNV